MNEFLISHSYWILLFPLIGFLVNGLILAKNHRKAAGTLSVVLSGFSMLYAIALVVAYFAGNAPQAIVAWKFPFLAFSKTLIAEAAFLLDPLSAMMVFVVTVIAFFVNIYSLGYMREVRAVGRFFALLSFFSFSMLVLLFRRCFSRCISFWNWSSSQAICSSVFGMNVPVPWPRQSKRLL